MEEKPLSELQPASYNPRKISDHDLQALRTSIREFGDLSGVIKNICSSNMVGGHQRLKIFGEDPGAKIQVTQRMDDHPDAQGTVALGYIVLSDGATFSYREVYWPLDAQDKNPDTGELLYNTDGTPKMISMRERAANIAANRIQGEFVQDLLAQLTKEINDFDPALARMTGQTEKEISALLDSFGEADGPEDDAPPLESVQVAASQSGQIYQLGTHRLMCGDSTDFGAASDLMDGAQADLIFTDPPYNVAYEGKTADALTIQNDKFKTTEAFYEFLLAAFKNMAAVAKMGCPIYIAHADSEGLNFRRAMINAGFLMKQNIIWVKNTMVLGRQDYQWQHEPILYGWKEGAAHFFIDDRTQTTVWNDLAPGEIEFDGEYTTISFKGVEIKVPGQVSATAREAKGKTDVWEFKKPARSEDHPTMKPVALVEEAIMNSSMRGGTVVDLFGGSGTTLIASERLGRKCYMMELDPKYCDVIRRRWWKIATGSDEGWELGTPAVNVAALATAEVASV